MAILSFVALFSWAGELEIATGDISAAGLHEISYPCSTDQSRQPAMWFAPAETEKPIPLLVGLHTWGGNYRQRTGTVYYKEAKKRGWAVIFPNFRGPNWTPDAMGSDKVVQDIVDAVKYATENAVIDPDRIYLCGASGGGFLAMLMAGRHPEIWAGVSMWCGISDIKAWHAYNKQKNSKYFRDIEKALKGDPETDQQAAEEAARRSPIHYFRDTKKLSVDIWHGAKDSVVPSSQSENAFAAIIGEQIADDKQFPAAIGKCKILRRKTCQNTRLTIFNSGHTIFYSAAIEWLSFQRKKKPAVWENSSAVTDGQEVER